jgi:Ca-activated chloride channel homolog
MTFGLNSWKHCRGGNQLFLPSLLIFLSIAVAPGTFSAQRSGSEEAQAKIVATSNLVVLAVKVTDSHGTFVSGLKQNDFRVFEDGQLQKLTVFGDEDMPVTVGLVVDHSRSMGPKLVDVVAAVSSFAHSNNPQDEMFVVDFNDEVSVELLRGKAFTNDTTELEKAVADVTARGRTALYDAVSEGLNHLQYGRWGKKALVIVSDGGDNASHLKFSQVLEQARRSQALIYSIALVGSDEEENPGLLRRLCKDTGGIAYFPNKSQSVADVSEEIAHDLREQYTLAYVPQNMNAAETFRKIEVKVSAPGYGRLRVRTRRGYTPTTPKQPSAQSRSGTR